MSKKLAFFVDIESRSDPYGYGPGLVVTVLAHSRAEAKKKANAFWKSKFPLGDGRAYNTRLAKDTEVIL